MVGAGTGSAEGTAAAAKCTNGREGRKAAAASAATAAPDTAATAATTATAATAATAAFLIARRHQRGRVLFLLRLSPQACGLRFRHARARVVGEAST